MPVAIEGRRAPLGAARPTGPAPVLVVRTLSLDVDGRALTRERLLLTPAELAHADRGTAPVARRRIVLRAGLRRLVGEVLGVPPGSVPLRAGEAGRPELDVAGIDVSCTSSAGIGLVAVAVGQRIGIDAEPVTPWREDVLTEGWLSRGELDELTELPPEAREVAAARCWTRKEALLKGLGTGLTDAMADLEVGTGASAVLVAGWRIDHLPAPAGHVVSLATATAGEGSTP